MCLFMMINDGVRPMAIILILISLPGFIFVAVMLAFHTYITAINLTTREFLDKFWN